MPALAPRRPKLGTTQGGLRDLPLPEPGFVRFRALYHDNIGLVAELDGPVTVIGGYGSHDITDRPARVGLTSYHGRPPLSLRLPLLFDRWQTRASVEDEIRVLEQMHGLDANLDRPPQIIVEGFGIPHSYTRAAHLRWVLTGDPDWGEDVRFRGSDGHRCYVPVTVVAQQVVTPTTLVDQQQAAGSGRQTYQVPKTGRSRTLRGIAKRYGRDWRAVRALNSRLGGDPDQALATGTVVRVT
jgi:hypothetical protein